MLKVSNRREKNLCVDINNAQSRRCYYHNLQKVWREWTTFYYLIWTFYFGNGVWTRTAWSYFVSQSNRGFTKSKREVIFISLWLQWQLSCHSVKLLKLIKVSRPQAIYRPAHLFTRSKRIISILASVSKFHFPCVLQNGSSLLDHKHP